MQGSAVYSKDTALHQSHPAPTHDPDWGSAQLRSPMPRWQEITAGVHFRLAETPSFLDAGERDRLEVEVGVNSNGRMSPSTHHLRYGTWTSVASGNVQMKLADLAKVYVRVRH